MGRQIPESGSAALTHGLEPARKRPSSGQSTVDTPLRFVSRETKSLSKEPPSPHNAPHHRTPAIRRGWVLVAAEFAVPARRNSGEERHALRGGVSRLRPEDCSAQKPRPGLGMIEATAEAAERGGRAISGRDRRRRLSQCNTHGGPDGCPSDRSVRRDALSATSEAVLAVTAAAMGDGGGRRPCR
jgi:hypothetical protein